MLTLLGTVFSKMSDGDEIEINHRIDVWTLLLADIDYKLAEVAAVKMLRSCRFEPKPADIIAAVRAIAHSRVPSPEQAWLLVQKEIARCGQYKAPEWSHAYIQEAVRTINWWNLCTTEIDLSARFMKIYESIVSRRRDEAENNAVAAIMRAEIRQLTQGIG